MTYDLSDLLKHLTLVSIFSTCFGLSCLLIAYGAYQPNGRFVLKNHLDLVVLIFKDIHLFTDKLDPMCVLPRTLCPYLHRPDFQRLRGHVYDLHLSYSKCLQFFFFFAFAANAAMSMYVMLLKSQPQSGPACGH